MRTVQSVFIDLPYWRAALMCNAVVVAVCVVCSTELVYCIVLYVLTCTVDVYIRLIGRTDVTDTCVTNDVTLTSL